MRAIEISRFGAPEVLRETARPDPVPASGEVLIRVAASGTVNRVACRLHSVVPSIRGSSAVVSSTSSPRQVFQ